MQVLIKGWLAGVLALALCASGASAQLVTRHSFSGTGIFPNVGPRNPQSSLVQSGTTFYGTTLHGGPSGWGTLFKFDSTTGIESTLFSFNTNVGPTAPGGLPYGTPLLLGTNLYGMTNAGAVGDGGTLYRFNTSTNTYSMLHAFAGGTTDGRVPFGAVVQSGTKLYGMTSLGGSGGKGTIFQYDVGTSAYNVLHHFAGGAADGATPNGSLIVDGSTLYGMTFEGGASNLGTVFKYDTATSMRTVLHSFTGGTTDGRSPRGSLILSDGVLYGMTSLGGSSGTGTIFSYD